MKSNVSEALQYRQDVKNKDETIEDKKDSVRPAIVR